MGEEHHCEWRDQAERLTAELAETKAALVAVQATVEKLQRHVFGKRSEKMPRVADELRDPADAEAARLAELESRQENWA